MKVFFNRVEDGRGVCCYVPQPVVADVVTSGNAVQWWTVRGVTVSAKLKRGGMVKRWEHLSNHVLKGETAFLGLMDECAAVGVVRPSSYADIFAQRFRSPAIAHSINALLSPGFGGGWQEAVLTGTFVKPLFRYDINSAYLWSLVHQGLPDPSTFYVLRDYLSGVPAVYLLYSPEVSGLPYPFSRPNRFVLASHEEMRVYRLDPALVVYGIGWTHTIGQAKLAEIVATCPASKFVSRSYWGRWASRTGVRCNTPNKQWRIRNPTRNLVWAHLIIAAVKLRVWTATPRVFHVFVDSIITDEELPVGNGIGEWRLDKSFADGLTILGPGFYGVPGCPMEKHSGLAKGILTP